MNWINNNFLESIKFDFFLDELTVGGVWVQIAFYLKFDKWNVLNTSSDYVEFSLMLHQIFSLEIILGFKFW